jgi:hypothetical protein
MSVLGGFINGSNKKIKKNVNNSYSNRKFKKCGGCAVTIKKD